MSVPTALLATPLRDAHQRAGAKLVPFAGWEMPLDYGSILEESRTVRNAAGLFDVSHMARFQFQGNSVAEELDAALGARMTDVPVGKARYSLLLAEDGGILDDLIVYRTQADEFFVVVNASNRARDWEALTARLSTTTCSDLTEDGGGILALQGPEAHQILSDLAGTNEFCSEFLDLGHLSATPVGDLFIARTGYTGEHGYEIFLAPGQAEPVWNALLERGAQPVGLGARDVLRLEAGLPLYGHEIHEGVDGFEAGLRFGMRGWKDRTFVGSATLAERSTPSRKVVGFLGEKRVPREGYPVLSNGKQVGTICSGIWSATLERPIATALVDIDSAGPWSVDLRGKELPLEETDLPFVPHNSRTKRA